MGLNCSSKQLRRIAIKSKSDVFTGLQPEYIVVQSCVIETVNEIVSPLDIIQILSCSMQLIHSQMAQKLDSHAVQFEGKQNS